MSTNKKQLIDTIKKIVDEKNVVDSFKNTSKVVQKLSRPEIKKLDQEEQKKISVKFRKRSSVDHPLRRIRIEKGFTLDDLAKKVGMSTSYLSRIEGGSRRLNSDIIRVLSAALDCRPGDLLDFDGEDGDASSAVDNVLMSGDDVRTSVAANVNQGGVSKDLPLFSVRDDVSIDENKISDWVVRPYELNGDSDAYAIAIKGNSFEPRYKNMEMLFISSHKTLTENCSVVAIKKDGTVVLGDYLGWSKTPESTGISDEDEVSIVSYVNNEEVKIKRKDIAKLHRIIGTMES